MTFDISHTLEPTSDQLDAVELIGGPRTFTIASVSKGTPEQPVEVHLDGFPRPWRPGKSMRRVLAAAWGTDASVYVGRRVTLYCDPSVRFGTDVVGGTRISHLSHLPKRLSVPLLVSRGKSATFTVDPLPDAPAEPTADQVAECADPDVLRVWWRTSGTDTRALIKARIDALRTAEESTDGN